MESIYWLVICILFLTSEASVGRREVVYKFSFVDYAWQNDTVKQQYIADKKYIMENNIITGLKVFEENVYVTVPRWKPGVPSTLNKVVLNSAFENILEPYPDWTMQTIGDCNALQYVQSMEIDPNTGYMWIIDTGRTDTVTNHPKNLCPAKIVIYDIRNRRIIHKYEFPDSIVYRKSNFMNDIVLDYVNGVAAFAYITDTNAAKFYVYDRLQDTSYSFQHPSMNVVPGTENIMIGENTVTTKGTIDGIAMGPNFQYVYYCVLNGYGLYRVPTALLRNKSASFSVEEIGRKVGLSDGMVSSDRHLYFGVLNSNAVYKWSYESDNNTFVQTEVIRNSTSVRWVDTFAIDEYQNLWFVANGLDLFFTGKMNFSNTNMFLWKIKIGENGYLGSADKRTTNSGNQSFSSLSNLLLCVSITSFMVRYFLALL